VKGNNREHNNERCVVHLFQYMGSHGEENLRMKSISNSVTGALRGNKTKWMGHSQPLTAFSFCRIGSQERSHVRHVTANTADKHKAAFPQLECLIGVCHLPCRGNGTLWQILANCRFPLSSNVTQINHQSWCMYRVLCILYYLDQTMHNILTIMSIS
jgi:hypothetical protein